MSRNQTATAPASAYAGNVFDALDALPGPLRRCVHEGVIQWDPCWILAEMKRAIRQGLPSQIVIAGRVDHMRREDEDEVRFFPEEAPEHFGGQPSPHQRARASIMRYDDAQVVRPRRRRAR